MTGGYSKFDDEYSDYLNLQDIRFAKKNFITFQNVYSKVKENQKNLFSLANQSI